MEKSKISEAELEIMKVVWQISKPANAYEIRQALEEKTGWERTTILTLIRRLVDKGLLLQEKREVYYYAASVSEQEYTREATSNLVDKLYNGNARNLVAALCQNNSLNSKDIDELRRFFNQRRGDNGE